MNRPASEHASAETAPAKLELLLLDTQLATPRRQASALHRAGFNLHPRILTNPDKLDKALRTQPVDILICNEGAFDGLRVLTSVAHHRPGLPVILVSDRLDPQRRAESLAHGARDLLPDADTDLLIAVFQREWQALEQARQANALRQRLEETEQQLQDLEASSSEAIAYLSDGLHLAFNRAYQDLFGAIDASDLLQQPLRKLTSQRDLHRLEPVLQHDASTTLSGEVELHLQALDYRTFEALLQFAPAMLHGQACTRISLRDLTRLRQLEQRVQWLSDYDHITGLPNRHQFLNQLDERVPELQRGKPGSLIYLSIDNMVSLRVRAGERATNELLTEIGGELAGIAAQTGPFARLGDHSFALFCRYQDKGSVSHLADALIQRFDHKRYSTTLPTGARPRFHLGIAEGSRLIETGEQLLEQAFRAYEAARSHASKRWLWFDDGMPALDPTQADSRDQDILQLIDDALASDRFRLFYQPVVSLNGDSREHYSVLVRMLRSDNRALLPESFFRHAHRHGRMAAIDRWVIKHALAELARQRRQGRRLSLTLHLSADSIRDPDLLLWICDCLQTHAAKGPWLTFQLSDQDVRSNPSQSRELINGLKRIHCRLSISRFGVLAHYESLLQHLPLDCIKLDPSYLKQLAEDARRRQRLARICQLAKNHGVQVIMGEVEEAENLRTLWDAGIAYVQGYLLQEPVESMDPDFEPDPVTRA